MAEPLEAEVERLRAEVEQHRQRELSELRAALAAMRDERDNYRSEANRIAEVGRQIAAEYQKQISELRGKLDAYAQVDVRRNRTTPIAN